MLDGYLGWLDGLFGQLDGRLDQSGSLTVMVDGRLADQLCPLIGRLIPFDGH